MTIGSAALKALLLLGLAAGALTPVAAAPAPADPASVLCVRNGATVTVEPLPNGASHAVCAFPNGSRIDAATYFRNKHRTH